MLPEVGLPTKVAPAAASTKSAVCSAWLCVRAGTQTVCPPVIAGVPAFKDTTHVGPEYQFKLIPIVRALLVSAGVDVGRRG